MRSEGPFVNFLNQTCCSTAHFHMVVKGYHYSTTIEQSCSIAHFHMVVKAIHSSDFKIKCWSTKHSSKKVGTVWRWLSRIHVSPVFIPCWVGRPPTMHDPNDKTWGCLLASLVAHRNFWRTIKHKVNPDIRFQNLFYCLSPFGHRDIIIESKTFSLAVWI